MTKNLNLFGQSIDTIKEFVLQERFLHNTLCTDLLQIHKKWKAMSACVAISPIVALSLLGVEPKKVHTGLFEVHRSVLVLV